MDRVDRFPAVKWPLAVSEQGDPSGHIRVVDGTGMVVFRMAHLEDALELAERIVREFNVGSADSHSRFD